MKLYGAVLVVVSRALLNAGIAVYPDRTPVKAFGSVPLELRPRCFEGSLQARLMCRVKQPGETAMEYCHDVFHLNSRVDLNMTVSIKVGCPLKGMDRVVYNSIYIFFVCAECTSITAEAWRVLPQKRRFMIADIMQLPTKLGTGCWCSPKGFE